MNTVVALSALRIDEEGVGHFYSTRVVGPVAERFVALAERSALLRPALADDHSVYAVLDMIDGAGDIVDDRHVPDEAAWNALNSELGLYVVAVEGQSCG